MRQRYWIPHEQAYITKILRKICKATQPFETTGVDLFGPIKIMENHVKTKRWMALFTCLATKAVHLEVMESDAYKHSEDL
uniref:Uncharacterized protein n=1 Tax=Onchocerca volvulus TaxID=6282 RepID=A0A8R1TJV9_ONCVO